MLSVLRSPLSPLLCLLLVLSSNWTVGHLQRDEPRTFSRLLCIDLFYEIRRTEGAMNRNGCLSGNSLFSVTVRKEVNRPS